MLSMFRFFPGLILIQAIAIAMMMFVVDISQPLAWFKVGGVLAVITLTVSFWFDALAKQLGKDAVATLNQQYAKERERIKVNAEREKSRVVQASEKKHAREAAKVQSRANMKVGASLSGAVGFGVLMLITEFITLGMLTLFTAGGAMSGYLLRGKQMNQRQLKVINHK
jgi:membrane protein implicated in regulation of membrane protease activity